MEMQSLGHKTEGTLTLAIPWNSIFKKASCYMVCLFIPSQGLKKSFKWIPGLCNRTIFLQILRNLLMKVFLKTCKHNQSLTVVQSFVFCMTNIKDQRQLIAMCPVVALLSFDIGQKNQYYIDYFVSLFEIWCRWPFSLYQMRFFFPTEEIWLL